ncbi:MAG TPA: TonB family protein [Candidatus Angelobacter sp.]|nr:TonB family protein [Candidatus Angelobacter sp.]
MQSNPNAAPTQAVPVPLHRFRLLVEPEPWLGNFARNVADCFRPSPPPLRISSRPGRYWSDGLVSRPVAWKQMGQSLLAHIVVVGAVFAISWLELNQPQVIVDEPQKAKSILEYQVSEYLPEVRPAQKQNTPPIRRTAQKADPEYSPQEIVSLNAQHDSTRQTIIQPDPIFLHQDVPLPNIVAWTPVPGAPVVSRNRVVPLPDGTPQIVPPAEAVAEHSRLVFPVAPQVQVVAPANPVASDHARQAMLAMNSPVVIPPSSEIAANDLSRLQLPAQAPQAVAAPPSAIASGHKLAQALPAGQPDVVPPAPTPGQRNLAALGMPGQDPDAVPPAQPVTSGMGRTQSREVGQLLALNARPAEPVGPLTVPGGNRRGEFAAGPEGHAGASARPETRAGDPTKAHEPGRGNGPSDSNSTISVSAPPHRVVSGTVVAGVPEPPPAIAMPNSDKYDVPASSGKPPSEKIEDEVFAGRRSHAMYINMPNLTSAIGSWSVRFAELKAEDGTPGELSAPEALRKVDPAYPAELLRDRIEGVVILHAVIHRDGSVGDVSVLEGFNDQLDANARAALEQWRFRPGLKNGVPVDVEAVIRVPFRVPRVGF